MRIAYCSSVPLGAQRSLSHHIAKECEVLARIGHEVHLYMPPDAGRRAGAFDAQVTLHEILPLKGLLKSSIARPLRAEIKKAAPYDLFITCDPALCPSLAECGPAVVEVFALPKRGNKKFLAQLSRTRLVIARTSLMRASIVEMGLTTVPVIVEGAVADLRAFASLPDPAQARSSFSLPLKVPIVGYAGHLESPGVAKGIPEFLDALLLLKKRGLEFHAVIAGGPQEVRAKMASAVPDELTSMVTFLGHIAPERVPTLLTACDVLVYPTPHAHDPHLTRDASPLKIVEYMASERPIVSADLPAIHDLLQEHSAFLFSPGDVGAFATVLREAIVNREDAKKRAKIARSDVENFTWKKRLERILATLGLFVTNETTPAL